MANEKRVRRPWFIILIFAAIIAYIIAVLITSLTKDKNTLVYEVSKGSVSEALSVTGIILRDESVYYAVESGDIEYYRSSGSKVKVGDIIYSVDKTGDASELLKEYTQTGESFNDEEKFQLLSLLSEYRKKYEAVGFEGLYEAKAGMSSVFLESVKELISSDISDSFEFFDTDTAGYIVFSSDGYEDLKVEDIKADMFNPDKYPSAAVGVKQRINEGEPAYKLITGDSWSIYCKLTPETVKEYDLENVNAVTVNLTKAGTSARANFALSYVDGVPYGLISMNKYVMSYARDRYSDFVISSGESTGLQVPNSAIVYSAFYKIPKEYLTKGNNSNSEGFIVENGENAVFKEVEADFSNTDFVFVKPTQLAAGSVLVMPDSDERFKVSETQAVKGVYLVNTGYAVFKVIDVISENKEYSILNEETSGVKHHDRILLDAVGYNEGDVVY